MILKIFQDALSICIYNYKSLYKSRMWHGVNSLRGSLTGLNSEFSFSYTACHIKAKEPSVPYYSSIAGGNIVRIIPFPRVLALWEMPKCLVWDLNSSYHISISYDYNHYTTSSFYPFCGFLLSLWHCPMHFFPIFSLMVNLYLCWGRGHLSENVF